MKKILIIVCIIIVLCIGGILIYIQPNATIKGIYNNLLEKNSIYSKMKKEYNGVKFKEFAVRDKIIIKTDNGSLRNKLIFSQDGDYLAYKCDIDSCYDELFYFKYVIDTIADNYDMDINLLNIYLDNMIEENTSDEYFVITSKGNKTTYKYYIKEKFDIPNIELYFQEGDFKDSLDVISEGIYTEKGKIIVHADKNEEDIITIVVGEYLDNTELTYKSIINSCKDIKPNKYEEFIKEFDSLKEIKDDNKNYTVQLLKDDEAKKELSYYMEDYKYVKIIFKKK